MLRLRKIQICHTSVEVAFYESSYKKLFTLYVQYKLHLKALESSTYTYTSS